MVGAQLGGSTVMLRTSPPMTSTLRASASESQTNFRSATPATLPSIRTDQSRGSWIQSITRPPSSRFAPKSILPPLNVTGSAGVGGSGSVGGGGDQVRSLAALAGGG